MKQLRSIINDKLQTKNINLLKFNQLKTEIADEFDNVNIETQLDDFFNKQLTKLANKLLDKHHQHPEATVVFDMFGAEFIPEIPISSIKRDSDLYELFQDYEVKGIGDEYLKLQKALKDSQAIDLSKAENNNFESIIWNHLAPRIVRYFNENQHDAKITFAKFDSCKFTENSRVFYADPDDKCHESQNKKNCQPTYSYQSKEVPKKAIIASGLSQGEFIITSTLRRHQLKQIKEQNSSKHANKKD